MEEGVEVNQLRMPEVNPLDVERDGVVGIGGWGAEVDMDDEVAIEVSEVEDEKKEEDDVDVDEVVIRTLLLGGEGLGDKAAWA